MPSLFDAVTPRTIERFLSKTIALDGCLIWKGSFHRSGYGQFSIGRRKIMAHRFAFWYYTDIDPLGMCVCHKCDTKLCVAKHHLWLGTQRDNIDDAMAKGRIQRHEQHWNARLTMDDANNIRTLYAAGGITQHQIAEQYDVIDTAVWKIISGKRWKASCSRFTTST